MIDEIIADLENAKDFNRDIDEKIFVHFGYSPTTGGYYGWERIGKGYWSRPTNADGTTSETIIAQSYTSSIDSVVRLMKERSPGVCFYELCNMKLGIIGGHAIVHLSKGPYDSYTYAIGEFTSTEDDRKPECIALLLAWFRGLKQLT